MNACVLWCSNVDHPLQISSSSIGADYLTSSTSVPLTSGLAHSSSTPSFHSFSSGQNASSFSPSNSVANPLAPHNFPALTNSNFSGSIAPVPATTLQYSAALNHRASPSTAPTRIPSPPLARSPERAPPRSGSPSDQAGVSAFQVHNLCQIINCH